MGNTANGEGQEKKASQVSIDMVQMGPDWVYFEAGQQQPLVEGLPLFLNQALIGWFARRSTLPRSRHPGGGPGRKHRGAACVV
jgi:hypothetical protein